MRHTIVLILAIMVLAATQTSAQYEFGLRVGIAPANSGISNNHVIVNTQASALTFNTQKAGGELYAGVFVRRSLDYGFFLESEALYRNQSMDYIINYLDNDAPDKLVSERTHEIAIPVSIGVDLGSGVEVSSGVMTRFVVSHNTGLEDFAGFRQDVPAATFGWQSSVGFNLRPVRFNVTYVLDFKNYGSHLFLYDKQLQLSNSASRIVASVAYAF